MGYDCGLRAAGCGQTLTERLLVRSPQSAVALHPFASVSSASPVSRYTVQSSIGTAPRAR